MIAHDHQKTQPGQEIRSWRISRPIKWAVSNHTGISIMCTVPSDHPLGADANYALSNVKACRPCCEPNDRPEISQLIDFISQGTVSNKELNRCPGWLFPVRKVGRLGW